jgi:hypothetical protein
MTRVERTLTAAEVAVLLGVHINTVKRIPPAELPCFVVRACGDRRYERRAVTRYKERRYVR